MSFCQEHRCNADDCKNTEHSLPERERLTARIATIEAEAAALREVLVDYMRAASLLLMHANSRGWGWDGQAPDDLAWVKDLPARASAAANGTAGRAVAEVVDAARAVVKRHEVAEFAPDYASLCRLRDALAKVGK